MTKKAQSPTQIMFADEDEGVDNTPHEERKPVDNSSDGDIKQEELKPHMAVEIPSRGALGYPSTVYYRDMLVKDEEILASVTPESYTKTLNGVLKDILVDCSFYEDMSLHDRDFLIVWIWAQNYETEKSTEIECSHCGNVDNHAVNLTELEQTDIKDNLVEPFTLETKSGITVSTRMIRVKDELFVEDFINSLSKKEKEEYRHEILTIASSLDLGIKMPFKQKLKWIKENITSKEMNILRNYHQYFSFGLNQTVEYKCSSCGEVTKGDIPFRAMDIIMPTTSSSDFEKFL